MGKSKRRPVDPSVKKAKIKRSKKIGFTLATIQLILTCIFTGLVVYLNVLPNKILIPILCVLLFVCLWDYLSQHSKKVRTAGKSIAVVFSLLLGIASYYLFVTNHVIDAITGSNIKIDEVSIIVLEENDAQTIQDAKDYDFGILKNIDNTNTQKALSCVETDVDAAVSTKEYEDINTLVDALYKKKVGAIVLNEAYRETLKETHENFDVDTRVLKTYTFRVKIATSSSNVKVTKEPFSVYITGIDTYGEISKTSRSDVNIIATINPKTKQILLVSTPRDYYVELSVAPSAYDKLTHAGTFGTDVSIKTLENLYDLNIDYYARINFSGFEKMIDALGGVTVHNEEAFTSIDGYYIEGGDVNLDGKYALAFARERHAFANGDNQRGINQMKVIRSIIDKVTSPSLLKNYTSILDSMTGTVETTLSSSDLSSLVKMQLDDNADWNVVSYNVTGTGDKRYTYSYSSKALYVMIPDDDSIAGAKKLQQDVLDGKTISAPDEQ